jgi:prophage tail gpP-like protein
MPEPAPPEPGEDRLTVEIEGAGVVTDRIISYRINTQYTTPTDSWEFVVFSEDDPKRLRRRFRPLQPVKLSIAGRQQLIGRIDGTVGTGESGALLKVHGRDYLADLVDSSVDPSFQIKKGQDIGAFLLELLKPWGITTVFGNFNLTRNVMSGRKPFTKNPARSYKSAKLEDTKASENQAVFEFGNQVVARQAFTLQPAGTRDAICVDAPNYEQAPLYTLSRPGNLISGTADRNYAGVPTVTIARGRGGGSDAGKQSPGAKKEYPTFDRSGPSQISKTAEVQHAITSDEGVVVVRESRFDPKARQTKVFGFDFPVYKPAFFRDRDSRNDEQLDYAVRRFIAEKLRETLIYTCSVRGHVDPVSGATWTVDTLAHVRDEIEDVDEPLWIAERTFTNDGSSGPMTELVLVRPGSYVF